MSTATQNPTIALADVRKGQSLSQTTVAENMGIVQSRVSAIERSDIANVQVDTLRSYVAALGGTVKIVAIIDGNEIEIG